nr:MAG: hypothetical protein DIU57_07100 [Pseudomonadota bacterium]
MGNDQLVPQDTTSAHCARWHRWNGLEYARGHGREIEPARKSGNRCGWRWRFRDDNGCGCHRSRTESRRRFSGCQQRRPWHGPRQPREIAVDFADHNFTKVAEGLGGKGLTVTEPDQIRDALEEAHKLGGPVVLDVKVDPTASHRDCSDYGKL